MRQGFPTTPKKLASDEMGNPVIEAEKPFHTITRDFDDSIQLDEERQEEDAENAEEVTYNMTLAEQLPSPRKNFPA